MSHQLPLTVRPVALYLSSVHGRYLQNVARAHGVTCEVCTTPVDAPGDLLCWPCRSLRDSGERAADRVGVMIYAEEWESQAYKVVDTYKGEQPGAEQVRVMRSLVALGLRGHARCAMRLAGTETVGWAVVPSSRGRTHLVDIVRPMTLRPEAEVGLTVAEGFVRRRFRPENFEVDVSGQPPEHVIVFDDSWVTGANAQSVAGALKRAGVQQVSVMVVARVLNPKYPATKQFLESTPRREFDPTICPWTGFDCPR